MLFRSGTPLVVGPDCAVFLQDDGTVTDNLIDVNECSIEFGVPVTPIPTITEVNANMEGLQGWTTSPADTLITLNIVPHTTGWVDDFQADTYKTFRFFNKATRGNGFAVACHRAEIVEHPSAGAADSVMSSQVVLRANRDSVNSSASTAELWESKVCLIMY